MVKSVPELTELTDLIRRMQSGDRQAGDSLFAAAAARLRKMSASLMRSENTAGFQASDLVQETYAQKVSGSRLQTRIRDRHHFFSIMALGMRQVLMDRGRVRNAEKRQAPEVPEWRAGDRRVIDLTTALSKLEKLDPESCSVVRAKHDYGHTWEEIAAQTGQSVWHVRAVYAHALHWLRDEIA